MRGRIIENECGGRRLTIYLPPSYSGGERYPVVYVQDGAFLFEPNLPKLESMFEEGLLRELILVGIEPINRRDEYTPWFAEALAPSFPDFGGQGGHYVELVADTIKPYIDRHYLALEGRQATAIAGASLGGLISMYAGLRRPDRFGLIASFSGSYWYEGFVPYLHSVPVAPEYGQLRIYMDVGSLEGARKNNIQKEMVPRHHEVYEHWQAQGLGPDRLRYIVAEGADHEDAMFIERFPAAMQWLFERTELS